MMSKASTAIVSTMPAKVAATLSTTSTKSQIPPQQPTLPPPSPGTFRHPRLTEIIARQSASSLTSRNIQSAAANAAALALTFILGDTLYVCLSAVTSVVSVSSSSITANGFINILRLYLITNIALSLRPVLPYINHEDEISDIPLTPSQRALLGLNPSTQSTPTSADHRLGGGYITPPRYRRTSGSFTNGGTPRASTERRSISANYSSSPLSTSRHTVGFSPSPQPYSSSRLPSGSPFSPSSPLLHKAVYTSTASRNELPDFSDSNSRGSGFGASTSTMGFSRPQNLRERDGRGEELGTPSPSSGKVKRNPGLNYKWLYEKGGKLPKSDGLAF